MSEIKITYYEDEIYKTVFQLNQCKNYKELMEKYLNEGKWIKESENPPYSDIDSINSINSIKVKCSYYKELTDFLNKQEERYYKNKMYKYIAPNEYYEKHQKAVNGIIVCDYNDEDENEKFRLKSDQFGFTVSGEKRRFENHPYGILWNLVKDKTEKERVYRVIAECIYRTRTLGGGFLWQIDAGIQKGGIYGYNTDRGKSYIEDRVDLTLLEIKHLFEWIKLGMPQEDAQDAVDLFHKIKGKHDDGLYSKIKKKIENKKQEEKDALDYYIEWLQHFDSFENYVHFFCFDDFVGNDEKKNTWMMPCDIMKSNLNWKWDDQNKCQIKKRVFLKEPTEYKLEGQNPNSYKRISKNELSAEELEQMLKNVAFLTLDRSYQMQKAIDCITG